MKTTSTDILKAIPDYEELIKVAGEISGLMFRKLTLESRIKAGEADVFKRAGTEEKFFQGGKPPATNYIENTYKHTGLENELLPLRAELAEVIAALEEKKLVMDVYKSMIDIWRTLNSSERAATI